MRIIETLKKILPRVSYNYEYFPQALLRTKCFNQLPANFTLRQLLQYAEVNPSSSELKVVAKNLYLSLSDL